MIIKSMPRKTRSFGQLLRYINEPAQLGPALLHNLRCQADEVAMIERELIDNSRFLSARRKGNYLYHEVLSFGVEDRELVTPALLEDLTRRYLELRAPYALAYAKAHFEKANPHVHLLISANNVGSSQRLRLSRRDFQQAKEQLEGYQRQQYPQLRHSVVFQQDRNRSLRQSRREQERERRQRHEGVSIPSRKEQVGQLVLETIAVSGSGSDCFRKLKAQGFELYWRGKHVAIRNLETGRRYRLRTLGIDETFDRAMERWKRVPERLRSIRAIEEQARARERQRGRGRSP